MEKRYWIRGAFVGLSVLVLAAVALGGTGGTASSPVSSVVVDEEHPIADVVQSGTPRLPALASDEVQLPELVEGNAEFAFDLYRELFDAGENLLYSPHSLSMALAMTYAGARGTTEQQMAQVLHYTLPQAQLHLAFNALDQALVSRGEEDVFHLHAINSLWGQQGYTFLDDFLDIQAEYYGTGLRVADFGQSEAARQTINQWGSDQTDGRVQDLVPPGVINVNTTLVLANAVYFKAAWMHPFAENATHDGAFSLLDGGQTIVPMMEQVAELGYAERTGMQVVELPYAGNELSMVILLPENGTFEDYVQGLNSGELDAILGDLEPTGVRLTMPKFRFGSGFKFRDALTSLGMVDAFGGDADFSGMDGTHELFIREVCHKAFVAVDETGTEAAAATTVVVNRKGSPIVEQEIRLDRPFVFLIRDTETSAILFLGHVVNPAG